MKPNEVAGPPAVPGPEAGRTGASAESESGTESGTGPEAGTARNRSRDPRRELMITAVLTVVGAGLAVGAGGRVWATVSAPDALTPIMPSLTGRDLAAVATALGWAGLAGVAALFAVRGLPRAVLGALLALFGVGIAWTSAAGTARREILDAAGRETPMLRLDVHATVHPTAWWAVSVAGGILLALAGVVTLARGTRWPGLSARYDPAGAARAPGAPAAGAPAHRDDPSGLWKSIDRGEDPTLNEDKEH